ncbi:MAG TPA: efflux RND transporter periplasmic adaptor subunit [Burkholderiaceae bacterium]
MSDSLASPTPPSLPAHHRKLRIAAAVGVVLAAAIVIAGVSVRRSEASNLQARADSISIPTVAVIAPGKVSAAGTLDLPGRLEANSRASIYARVSGYLKSWKVDIGAPVKAGRLLAEIETPDLDQQLLQARADLASATSNALQAQATAKRWQALLSSDSVSRQEAEEKNSDLTAKQAMVKAGQANVDRFRAMKDFTRIVAPFDGVVTARNTDVGALINVGGGAGQELFVVSDTRKLRVYVTVPQSYTAQIKRGTKARLSVPERPGQSFTATVESVSGAVNAAAGGMLIQLAVDNAKGELLPGGFASVNLDLPQGLATLSIPPSALVFNKKGLQVATVDADNKIVVKPVTIARDYGKYLEIASGLAADDRVVESPPDGIASGDPVHVAEKAAPAAGSAASGNK